MIVRLTDPQISAIECRDCDELLMSAFDGKQLVFAASQRDALASEINDASNAEGDDSRRNSDPVLAKHAGRASRSLTAVYGKILKAKSQGKGDE